MKRLSKVSCGLLLTASLLIRQCFQDADRRQIIQQRSRNIRTSWNPLRRRMKKLKAQLGITETQSAEETQTAAETENQSQEMGV